MPSLGERLQHAWNAFMNKDPTPTYKFDYGLSSSFRPDRPRMMPSNEHSIIASIETRISIDVAAIGIKHVRTDDNDRFLEEIDSDLNNCLTLRANKDQTARAFVQDIVISMLDEGVVAVVPTKTDLDPAKHTSYKIGEMRTGKITSWSPDYVRIRLYNDFTGRREEKWFPKRIVSIIENPLYPVMNEPNSTLKRLIRSMNYLDQLNANNSSGKLDLLIQLPYTIRTDTKRAQAEHRKKDIEMQLAGSKFGIAYIDSTEKVTQLNRPLDNNLQAQVNDLKAELYGQLGISEEILKGTADEQELLNYYNRTVEPIISAIVDEMKCKFLTKTARSQKQSIMFFRDPFKLVPINNIAEIADKFTRNEILTSNEVRGIIGLKPSQDPKADELRNKNLNQNADQMAAEDGEAIADKEIEEDEGSPVQNGSDYDPTEDERIVREYMQKHKL